MHEYKVVPAPTKGVKAKGVKTPEARFALGVEQAINALATEGWEYVRSDVLPSEERQGLTGSTTNWRTLMVFRRLVADVVTAPETAAPVRIEPVLAAPVAAAAITSEPEVTEETAPEITTDATYEEGSEETRPT